METTYSSPSSSLALFKAKDKHSNQEMYFETHQEACEWMSTHREWVLTKRDIVRWTFPLDKTIAKECWVKIM